MDGLNVTVGELSANQAWEIAQAGEALIVDLSHPTQFAGGHPKGSLNLPYSAKGLKDRLGLLVQSGTPVIFIAEGSDQAQAAVAQLEGSSVPVAGIVEGNRAAWNDSNLPTEILSEISIQEITRRNSADHQVILDVREPIEWELGHVPGALLISLGSLRHRLQEIPRGATITVICEAGIRSSSAASLLQAAGFANVDHVPEGTGGYRNAGLPLQFTEEIGLG
jgi:hydroxyacylglutathione hydrolase